MRAVRTTTLGGAEARMGRTFVAWDFSSDDVRGALEAVVAHDSDALEVGHGGSWIFRAQGSGNVVDVGMISTAFGGYDDYV